MKMAISGNKLMVKGTDNREYAIIRSWGRMTWNKSEQMLVGVADAELLDKFAGIMRLPPEIEARRVELHAKADAIDRERFNPTPTAFIAPPVKAKLYAHQTRGYNMALLTFGWVEAGR